MDNAIKFSQAGSVITVWVKEEILDDGRAFFAFYCKDQGVGMSEDFIAHAFDMFSQESETSRSRYEGTGLGLAITKQLVDRMDGSAIRSLKHPDAETIPIIAMTANAFREDKEKCLAAGMNAHLAKPIKIENIKRILCEYCV